MWRNLEVAGPFDFELSLRFVCLPPRAAAHLGGEPYVDFWLGREYRRAVWLTAGTGAGPAGGAAPSRLVLLRLRNQGTVDRPGIQFWAEPDWDAGRAGAMRDLAAHVLSAGVRLEEFYAATHPDRALRGLGERFHGLKVIRSPSLYECLVSTVLEQQLNYHFANTVKRRLLAGFGEKIAFEGRTYGAYPPPERLAALRPAELRALQISERKASYIIGIARAAAAGELAAAGNGAAGNAVRERLLGLKGVGRWTAEYAALRGLGDNDALPAEDVGLQKAVGQIYGLRGHATALGIERRWRRHAPWRGYATYYCWFTHWA